MEHSKLPLKIVSLRGNTAFEIWDSNDQIICNCAGFISGDVDKEHAEFIVKACNNHDDLLKACKDARKWFEDFIECKPRPDEQSAIDMQKKLHEVVINCYKAAIEAVCFTVVCHT